MACQVVANAGGVAVGLFLLVNTLLSTGWARMGAMLLDGIVFLVAACVLGGGSVICWAWRGSRMTRAEVRLLLGSAIAAAALPLFGALAAGFRP